MLVLRGLLAVDVLPDQRCRDTARVQLRAPHGALLHRGKPCDIPGLRVQLGRTPDFEPYAVKRPGDTRAQARAARAEDGGIKLTVLYAKQKDPEAFNKYYLSKHMPLVAKIPGLKRTEVATALPPPPDQSEPPYWRITELYFQSVEDLQKAFASEEGKASAADLANFVDKDTVTIFASTIAA